MACAAINFQVQKESNSNLKSCEKLPEGQKVEIVCYFCNRKGRYMRNCRKRKVSKGKQNHHSNYNHNSKSYTANNEAEATHAFIVTSEICEPVPIKVAKVAICRQKSEIMNQAVTDAWLSDCGAS